MKKYLLSLFLCCALCSVIAQVSIQPVLPLTGIIQKNNLWNIAIINTSPDSYEGRIELTLRDRKSGMEVLTATTGQFHIQTGAKQVNSSLLIPIHYNYISSSLSTRTDDFIPIGDYLACYHLTAGKDISAEECSSFDVEPLSPPILINPADSSSLEVSPSQFSWIPPAPMSLFSRLQYQVMIAEIQSGQKPEEAMQQNLPFYTEPNVPVNNLTYRGMAIDFEKDRWYAWQVVASDDNNYAGKSDVFVFKVNSVASEPTIMDIAPFIKLKKNGPEKGIAPNGILKISYINETTDSIAHIVISNLTDKNIKSLQFIVSLKPGENLISYNVQKYFHLDEGKTYQATIENSRHENWLMQFEIRHYKEKKPTNK